MSRRWHSEDVAPVARVRALFDDPVGAEEVAVSMAAGARWKIIFTMAVLAATGGGLVVVQGWDHSAWWQAAIVATVVLLAVTAVFARVPWRLGPARIFALPEEIPGWQRRFERVGRTLLCGRPGARRPSRSRPVQASQPDSSGLDQEKQGGGGRRPQEVGGRGAAIWTVVALVVLVLSGVRDS